MARRKNIWERLNESTEGPNVTISIPREWAEELMRSIMTSLEIEDGGGEPDEMGEPHAEPDEDDLGGPPDGDADDGGFSADEDDEVPDFAAGDDDDDDDSDEDDSDDDDDDEKDEGADMDGARPKTALGESTFARLSRKLGRPSARPSKTRRR